VRPSTGTVWRGKIVEGGFLKQRDQAFANLRRALESDGSSLADVIKVTIFVTDMGNFKEVVERRRQFFSAPYPMKAYAPLLLAWHARSAGMSPSPTQISSELFLPANPTTAELLRLPGQA